MRRPAKAPRPLTESELLHVNRILSLLSVDYWLPASALAINVGVGERQLRRLVHLAREREMPIVSSNLGYKIRKTDEEAQAFERRVGGNARGQLAIAGSVMRGSVRDPRGVFDGYGAQP